MRRCVGLVVLVLAEVAAALVIAPHRAGTDKPRMSCAPQLGLRVKIVSVGKTKEKWLQSAVDLYVQRLRSVVEIDCVWVRDDDALVSAVAKCNEPAIILDERGSQSTSVEFATRMYAGLEEGGSRLTFFIGGAEGLPAELKADRKRLLSLSRLTFTHQMARLLLVEQIYRATEIRKGSGYHKD
jgi:23S rRNA (pseudouridine1915-N3)-methyltransferase